MKILGIDSGIERTGYAVFEKDSKPVYIASGLISTSKKYSMSSRLNTLYDEMKSVVIEHRPDVMVVEQLFFFKNQKTVIPVAQSQGVVLLAAEQSAVSVEFLTPLQIKQIVTGYGNADKEAVLKMVRLSLPKEIVLTKKIDDEIDAIACALAYSYLNKSLM